MSAERSERGYKSLYLFAIVPVALSAGLINPDLAVPAFVAGPLLVVASFARIGLENMRKK